MPFIVTAVTAIAGAISGVLAAGGIGAALLRIGRSETDFGGNASLRKSDGLAKPL